MREIPPFVSEAQEAQWWYDNRDVIATDLQDAVASGTLGIGSIKRAALINAHAHCGKHREEIENSTLCGCFYCCATFSPLEIKEWVSKDNADPLCPRCGIDSVIGDKSGYPLIPEFLKQMQEYWFKRTVSAKELRENSTRI